MARKFCFSKSSGWYINTEVYNLYTTRKLFLIGILIVLALPFFSAENNDSGNSTNKSDFVLKSIEIIKFFPKEFKLGDVQFNIQIKNNLNQSVNSVIASISGKGFSTYDIVPIESIGPFEKDYIFVSGNFKEAGIFNLSIRIEDEVFYQEVSVIDINAGKDIEEIKKQEKIEKLNNLSRELEILKKDYADLEIRYSERKDDNYDVSKINLDDLKKYIRSIETDILYENTNSAEVTLRIAKEEFEYQNEKLSNARVVPFITRLRDNALIISAIVGAILAIIALSDIIKRQSSHAITSVAKITRKKKVKIFKKKK